MTVSVSPPPPLPEQQQQQQPQQGAIRNITSIVLHNLQDQHDWTSLEIQTLPGLARPLIRGLPPRLLYLHPDDQIAALSREKTTGARTHHDPELEWVLAVHISEKWSLAGFAAVFDAIPEAGRRAKRVALATLHNDSTVVYYLLNEGMVKPRQN